MFGKDKNKKTDDHLTALRDRIENQARTVKEAPAQPAEAKVKGNGNGKKTKEALKDTEPVEVIQDKKTPVASTKDDLEKELANQLHLMELESENKIPGNGWLFNIKDKHLPESTVLDRGEVLMFALGNMQENMLNHQRTESLFAMFAKDVMRMNISVKGLSREQALMARQQDADRNATANTIRDLTGRPGAL